MPYRTVFNGTRMVFRKVQKQKGGAVAQVIQAAPVEEKIVEKPVVQKPEDKKALQLKYAAEIMKIM